MSDRLPRLDAEAFSRPGALPEQEVQLPSMGGSVLVRGFTKGFQQRMRREAMGADGEMDNDKLELAMFTLGIVDPVITPEQAAAAFEENGPHSWAATDIDAVLQAVLGVNGLAPGSAREAALTFRDEPGE